MMARKLAGLFAILGVMSFLASWMWKRYSPSGGGAMPVEHAWETGVYVGLMYWLIGLFLATLGIGLVKEVLAERLGRETERKFKARQRYDSVLSAAQGEGEAEPEKSE